MLHEGIIRLTGQAPFPLFWTIGRDPSTQLLFLGERLAGGAARP